MKLRILATTLEGTPISGCGEIIESADCIQAVETMRCATPFTALLPVHAYMLDLLSRIEGQRPSLPDGTEDAAAEFLTRLAQHGLIEFLPDNPSCEAWPNQFLEALEAVRNSGLTNMLDHPEVTRLAAELGFAEVVEWLADHLREYATFVLEHWKPLPFVSSEKGGHPCVDK